MLFKKKRKCKYEYVSVDYKCSRSALPGDECCIFHSKDIEGKKDIFNEEFWKEFERQKKHENDYDFTEFVFPGDISFEGKEFEKEAYFMSAQFSGEADFRNAKFSEVALFAFAQFSGKADFTFAQFSGAYFFVAQFSGEAVFEYAQFSRESRFDSAKFFGPAIFNSAKFKEDANFENIKIEKYNSFEMFYTYFFNLSGLFEFIETNEKKFKYSKYSNKKEFLPDNFRLILGEKAMARYPSISRQIKDDMYLLDKKERISKMSGIKRIWNKLFYFLWWLTADYGRSFKRWLLCCFVIIFIFGAIFADYSAPDWEPKSFWHFFSEINPQFQISPETRAPTWFTPYYFSIVTFTTLGFGDVTPLNLAGEIWLAIEGLLGYIMLGGLISILANKLARRS